MESDALTPAELLERASRRDSSRPLVTFYDDSTGERVELSVATFANWAAKTAGLLSEGLNLEPGERVALLLPGHWQSLVWAFASWHAGLRISVSDTDAEVVVVSPATLDAVASANAQVVALSLQPLGGAFTDPLPAGVIDYAVEVPSFPDQFVPIVPPAPQTLAFDHPGGTHTLAGLTHWAADRANHLDVQAGSRLMVADTGRENLHRVLLDALLVPLVIGGSSVLVRHEKPENREARVEQEKITHVSPESVQ